MIRYLKHTEIDKQKWDECIDRSVNGIIYAYSWYLDIVSPGWDALVDEGYHSVFPLTHRKKFFIFYLFQPFFTQQLGVFTRNHLTPSLVDQFIESIPPQFRFCRINLNAMNKIDARKHQCETRINLELDLVDAYENLAKRFDQNTRRNIRKAATSNLKIIRGVDPDELIKLFQINFGNKENLLRFSDYEILRKLILRCTGHHAGITIGVTTQEGKLCAAVFLLKSKNRWIFHFAASDKNARENGAMFLLVDHFIKEHAGSTEILDFEGSNDSNVARFYKGFGAGEVNYYQVTINRLHWVSRWLFYFWNRIRGR